MIFFIGNPPDVKSLLPEFNPPVPVGLETSPEKYNEF
jgi:hypothetical protein